MDCTTVPGLEAAQSQNGMADNLVRDARGQASVVSGEQRHGRDSVHVVRVPWGPGETGQGGERG